MDPKGLAREVQYEDQVAIPGHEDEKKGFSAKYTYNDGTTATIFYRYNENTPVVTLNGTDAAQTKKWEDQQKKATPPGGRTEIPENGRRMGWNPDTGQYDKDLGPVPPTATESRAAAAPPPTVDQNGRHFVWHANPDGNGGKWEDVGPAEQKPSPTQLIERNGKTFAVRVLPDGTVSSQEVAGLPGAKAPSTSRIVEGADGKSYVVTIDADGHGTSSPVQGLPGKPQTAVLDGKLVQLKVDDQGNLSYTEVPGTTAPGAPASTMGWRPDVTKPDLGLFDRRQQHQQAVEAGQETPQQAQAALKEEYALAQTVAENVRNIQLSGTSQRGQDVALVNQRNVAAVNNFGTATKVATALNADLPKGSDLGGQGLFALLQLANNQMRQYGALENPQAVTPGTNYPGLPTPEQLGINQASAAAPAPTAPAPAPTLAPEPAPAPATDVNAPTPPDTATPSINAGVPPSLASALFGGNAQPAAAGAAANLEPNQMAMGAMPASVANLMQGRLPDPVTAELQRLGFGQDAIAAGQQHYQDLLQQRLLGGLFGQAA